MMSSLSTRSSSIRISLIVTGLIVANLMFAAGLASAQSPQTENADETRPPVEEDTPVYVIEIHGDAPVRATDEPGRARDRIDSEELERRQPSSPSEALLAAPGVSVQKTNHAGGSVFIRGLTGQKTVLLIDGFRLGTGIMRPGPSQYLNTVPVDVLDSIDIVRGTSSVLHGSDAIGGAIQLNTRSAARADDRAILTTRGGTAEWSVGGRAEVGGSLGAVAVRAGVSARSFGNLRGAGPIVESATVPIYRGDEQLFTGYRDLAADIRAALPLAGGRELSAAVIAYRQFGAPRTDKCTLDACLVFDEQFYDLAYLRYRGRHGRLGAVEAGLAVARTHERRSNRDVATGTVERELDVVWTLSGQARALLPSWRRGDVRVRVSTGVDVQAELLSSTASLKADGVTSTLARGKFLDGSRTASAAVFALADTTVGHTLGLTAGVRMSAAATDVPVDPESGADGFRSSVTVPVASVGVRVRLAGPLHVAFNLDQGYRAPNLYDLTARSGGSGPGYQLPNPDLEAESSLTAELGLDVRHERFRMSGFVYQTRIDNFIAREPTTCPDALSDRCSTAEVVYRTTNADSALVRGVELAAAGQLGPYAVQTSATWTRGERALHAAGTEEPLPKMPPVHGAVTVRRASPRWFIEVVGRWALAQNVLAPRDIADRRIPDGGTPGYTVLDARVGGRIRNRLRATLTVHNLTDRPYRIHGSGVDGAGLGAIVTLSGGIR